MRQQCGPTKDISAKSMEHRSTVKPSSAGHENDTRCSVSTSNLVMKLSRLRNRLKKESFASKMSSGVTKPYSIEKIEHRSKPSRVRRVFLDEEARKRTNPVVLLQRLSPSFITRHTAQRGSSKLTNVNVWKEFFKTTSSVCSYEGFRVPKIKSEPSSSQHEPISKENHEKKVATVDPAKRFASGKTSGSDHPRKLDSTRQDGTSKNRRSLKEIFREAVRTIVVAAEAAFYPITDPTPASEGQPKAPSSQSAAYPLEKEDIFNPDWEKFKCFETDDAKCNVRELWGRPGRSPIDPNVNLTVENCRLRTDQVSDFQDPPKGLKTTSTSFLQDEELSRNRKAYLTEIERFKTRAQRDLEQMTTKYEEKRRELRDLKCKLGPIQFSRRIDDLRRKATLDVEIVTRAFDSGIEKRRKPFEEEHLKLLTIREEVISYHAFYDDSLTLSDRLVEELGQINRMVYNYRTVYWPRGQLTEQILANLNTSHSFE